MLTFSINEVCPDLDAAVRLIHTKVFDDKEIAEYQSDWISRYISPNGSVQCTPFLKTVEGSSQNRKP